MRNRFKCLIFLLLFPFGTSAQTLIRKIVVDTQKTPLVGAVVTCLDKNDKLLHGEITDENGLFSITANFSANEWLRISHLGYESVDYNSISQLPDTIVMEVKSEELGEIVVQAKSIVTQKSDRLVFSLADENITKGNNTQQLLRFTPMMRMENDRVTMLGKSNFHLYINGKKTNMSDDVLQNYLRNLPAEKIERIELITDPGSEYRVGANEGILNLVLKKDESQGWKGNLSLYDQLGYYNTFGGGLNLDYQKNDFTLSLGSSGTYYHEKKSADLVHEYINEDKRNYIDQTASWDYRLANVYLNMDYKLADNHYIGVLADYSYNWVYDYNDSQTDYTRLSSSSVDSVIYSENKKNLKSFMLTTNLNYRWKTNDKGSELGVDVDYMRLYKDENQPGVYFYDENHLKEKFTQNTNVSNYNYSAKVEYKHVFNSTDQFSVGSEAYYTSNKQDFFYGNFLDDKYESDAKQANLFELDENYWAAYMVYNRKWNAKFSSVLGVRSEYLKRKGISRNTEKKVKTDDFSMLPSVSLVYRLNDNHQLSYSLTSRREYPYYTLLNPFRYFVSPTIYIENDSNLDSRYLLSNSLRYILKQHYIFNVGYTSSKASAELFTPEVGGYTRISTQTFGRIHLLTGSFNWNDSFWDSRLYLNTSFLGRFNRSYGELKEYKIDVSNFSYDISVNWNLLLSKQYNWNWDGMVMYYSKRTGVSSIASDGFFYLNLGLRKSFRNGISVKLAYRGSLYNTMKDIMQTENYNLYRTYENHGRKLTLDISIPFGRKKVSGASYKMGASSMAKEQINN